jgi:hypothetical protein
MNMAYLRPHWRGLIRLLPWLLFAMAASACKQDSGVDEIDLPEEESGDGGELNAACSNSDDCRQGLSCNAGRRICVECIVSADCTESEQCEVGACVEIPRCATTDDCPSGVCDTERELCVGCALDTDCTAEEICVATKCQLQCEDDAACPDGRCDTANAVCVACLDDADCRSNQHCGAGATCDVDVCRPGDAQCSGNELLTCNAAGSGLDAEMCSEGCVDGEAGPYCEGEPGPGAEPEPLSMPTEPAAEPTPEGEPVAEPGQTPSPAAEPSDEPSAEPSSEPVASPDPTPEPGVEPAVEPSPNPEPVLSGTPALLIVVERSSSMFGVNLTDAGTYCASGSSPPYGEYIDRWEAMRAIVASLEDLSSDIDFSLLSFNGTIGGTCPAVSEVATASDGFSAVAQALEPTELACPSPKGESPTAAGLERAADILTAAAPNSPKYLLLFTRGTPDTCAVPDPQCGEDPAIGVVQDAYARGITTLVVSLHDEAEEVYSEHLAQAGQGRMVVPYFEDSDSLSCLYQEHDATDGDPPFNYDAWRDFAQASYAATGYTYDQTLAYTGNQQSELHATLSQIAMGTF